jgi:LysR family transcriptional activator of glutamate synthase operon
MGFLHSLGVAISPSLIRWHQDRFPSVRFELHQRSGQALLEDLSTGATDVCLSYPMTFDHTLDVEWEPLFTQQLYAVVDREHPLATRGVVGFDELAEQPFVAPQPGSHAAQDIRRCVRPAWRDPDDCVRGNRHHHATRTHRGTIGRRYPPPRFDTITDVVEIAVDDDHLVRPIAIGWMANRFLPSSAASFRDSALAWRRARQAPHDTAQPVQRRRGSNARRKQR